MFLLTSAITGELSNSKKKHRNGLYIIDFINIIYDKDDRNGIVLVTINRPEIKNALADVERVYDQKIADAFEIGILNDWLKVTVTPEILIWEPIGPGAMIFDEIEKGSNTIVMKRTI